jgi:hypothetical protein
MRSQVVMDKAPTPNLHHQENIKHLESCCHRNQEVAGVEAQACPLTINAPRCETQLRRRETLTSPPRELVDDRRHPQRSFILSREVAAPPECFRGGKTSGQGSGEIGAGFRKRLPIVQRP